jgi:hypothetical protein
MDDLAKYVFRSGILTRIDDIGLDQRYPFLEKHFFVCYNEVEVQMFQCSYLHNQVISQYDFFYYNLCVDV